MEQQVLVYDANKTAVGATFRRRAKQLVGKGRAVWLDGGCSALMLAPEPEEEKILEDKLLDYRTNGDETPKMSERVMYDEDNLRLLARKNVKEKRNLVRHAIAFALAWPFMILCYYEMFDGGMEDYFLAFAFGFLAAWGCYIVSRVWVMFGARIMSSFSASRPKADPIEQEYARLKGLQPDKVSAEYDRL